MKKQKLLPLLFLFFEGIIIVDWIVLISYTQ